MLLDLETPRANAQGVALAADGRDAAVVDGDAQLPRLFERFYRVDRARSRALGGTGLAIVKHVAQRHGGSASVDSEPGVRTCFRIVLPLARPA